MDTDLNKVKLDVCFINESTEESKDKLRNEIKELVKEGLYFKALKRHFSLLMIEKKIDNETLNILNSDYGILYKFINSLQLIVSISMCLQNLNHWILKLYIIIYNI
jgi:hypothetical protein